MGVDMVGGGVWFSKRGVARLRMDLKSAGGIGEGEGGGGRGRGGCVFGVEGGMSGGGGRGPPKMQNSGETGWVFGGVGVGLYMEEGWRGAK